MRTSATGTAERRAPGKAGAQLRRKGWAPACAWARPALADRGFTLVELMVVLVIVGLVSAAVVLAMPDPRGALRGEALRFAARADAARERAMMDNRPVALVLKDGGYDFEWRKEGEWRAMAERPFIAQRWSEGTRAAIDGGETRITFDSTGFAEPAHLRLVRGRERAEVEIGDGGRVHVVG